MQAQEQMALRLYATDGQQYDFLLADQSPRIQCAGGVMTISFKEEGATETDAVLAFRREDVNNLCFVSKEVDAVTDVQQHRIQFSMIHANELFISGLTAADQVRVFTGDGRQVPVVVSRQGDSATVVFEGQRHGLYIVSVNNQYSFKLMKP